MPRGPHLQSHVFGEGLHEITAAAAVGMVFRSLLPCIWRDEGLTMRVSNRSSKMPGHRAGLFVSGQSLYPLQERMMKNKQKAAKEVLQNELLKQRGIIKPLSDDGESKEGYSFTEVERVTVCFGPDGGSYCLRFVHTKTRY